MNMFALLFLKQMSNQGLEDIQVYQKAMKVGERIWESVESWKYFYQMTIGKQLIASTDSIAANISEGYGRYFYKENRNFCFYARGSLTETKTWITKAGNRNLISETEVNTILKEL